jgi:hypothetical protein
MTPRAIAVYIVACVVYVLIVMSVLTMRRLSLGDGHSSHVDCLHH